MFGLTPSWAQRNRLDVRTLLARTLKRPPRIKVPPMQQHQFGHLPSVSTLTLGGGGLGMLWGPTTFDECVLTSLTLEIVRNLIGR